MSSRKKRPDVTVRTKTAAARSPAERLEPGRAPSRPRGLEAREPSRFISGTVRFFSGLLTISLVGMLTLSGIGLVVYHQYETPGPLDAARMIIVPKGEGRREIAERLEREGIITNRWTFIGGHLVQSLFGGRKSLDLKAGEYEIDAHASMREVMETIASGKSILYKVTVPEGLTSKQIIERLKGEENLTGEIANAPAEGTLLPDTYQFSKGTSRQEIIDKMQDSMSKTIAKLWETRTSELPLRSLAEAVTFASIVEKETGQADERHRVAAVFYNRLKKGMRLQSDPTIIYGLTSGAGSLGRGITKADIETKTPYNTYVINGLPPGPIANPGKAALEATFNPAKTNDLYFVADGTGGHAFSETLKDHNSAVQKWRQVE
ncbi:MAG TPA: endolytic transglycosylase MltG, partial [Hyphomicrobium sp.]|nr:endolytic transglycosylase MltG [Hyphomicrobium sp.]